MGSASPDLIRNSSESLAGRISYNELHPFNLLEVKDMIGISNHWFRGGFPDAMLQNDDDLRQEWYYNFVKTYVERDLPMLGLGLSPIMISRFWKMLATIHGNMLNKSNLSKSLEMSYPTISRYLDFLEETFLIHQLYPYSTNLKKRLVKSPKVYLRDAGVLHHQLNIRSFEDLQGHSFLGVSWEGYVIEQIKQMLPMGYEMFFYRTHEGTEMDLVLVKNNQAVAGIEIKYTSTPSITKSMKIAMEDLKTKNNFIIIPGNDEFQLQKNVTVCGLHSFLKRHLTWVDH